MLALSRKHGEDIIIIAPPSKEPQRIVVRLLDTQYHRAKIGVSAPPDVIVNRAEVQGRIDAEQSAP